MPKPIGFIFVVVGLLLALPIINLMVAMFIFQRNADTCDIDKPHYDTCMSYKMKD